MKIFLRYFLIVSLFGVWGIILTNKEPVRESFQQAVRYYQKPCSKPIRYSIGRVDQDFGISREKFQKIVFQSEYVWENSLGKNLFQYDENSEFKINLIFDSRQARTIESINMEGSLSELESSYRAAEKQYDSLSAQYEAKADSYNGRLREYERRLDKYNEKVAYWNSKGGAPEEEYEDLKDEKKELEKTFSNLERERKEINALVGKVNSSASQSNDLAENYNRNLNTYKDKFGESVQFDKGIYDGLSISVYQFYQESDLRLTLAHELGHALGIDHVGNPRSLMHYLMGEQDIENPELSAEDLAELKKVCRIN